MKLVERPTVQMGAVPLFLLVAGAVSSEVRSTAVPAALTVLEVDGLAQAAHRDARRELESPDHGHHGGGHELEAPGHGHHGGGHEVVGEDSHEGGHAAQDGHGHEEHEGHTEHGAHEESHGHHTKFHAHEAYSTAVGLIAAVVLIPSMMYMLMTEGKISEYALKMVDNFVSIFLAVLWFNVSRQFFSLFNGLFPYAEEVFTVLQVVVLFCLAHAMAYLWRDNTLKLTTFCTCGAHLVAFLGIAAGGETQHVFTHATDKEYAPGMAFLFCVVLFLVLLTVSIVYDWVFRSKVDHKKYNDSIDAFELDFTGLLLSYLLTQAVRHALTGRYPPQAHLLQVASTGGSINDPHGVTHRAWQRWFMIMYAVVLTLIAAFLFPFLNQFDFHDHRYGRQFRRAIRMMKVMLVMCIAWGYLLWGEWEFYETLFTGDPMFGHMLFAVGATFVCFCVLVILGNVEIKSAGATQSLRISVTGVSLVAAWSWEHCFNEAVNIIGDVHEVGYGGLVPKFILAIIIPIIFAPVYFSFIKPRVIKVEEAEEELEEEECREAVEQRRLRQEHLA